MDCEHLLSLADAEWRESKSLAARRLLEEATALEDCPRAFLMLGDLLHEEFLDYEAAERSYREAADRGIPTGLLNLGVMYAQMEYGEAALTAFNEAAERGESDAWIRIGDLLASWNEDEEALKAYGQGAERGSVECMVALVETLGELGRHDEAIPWAERALKAGNARAALLAGRIHLRRNDTGRAEKLLRQALSLGLPQANLELADLLSGVSGRWKEVESFYEEAVRCRVPGSLNNFAIELEAQGRVSEAKKMLEKAAIMGDGLAWKNLGQVFMDEGDYEAAADCFKRAAGRGVPGAQELMKEAKGRIS